VEGVADTDEAALAKSDRLLEAITSALVNDFGVAPANIKEKK